MKKIFVLVDYQKDFVNGALGFEEAAKLDSAVAARIRQAHANKELVVCTMDTHGENYMNTQEGRKLPIPHTIKGTDGWTVYGETGKALFEDDKTPVYIEKPTFGSTLFSLFLRDYVKDEECEIEFGGVITNMCVISNAVVAKATLPEAKIKVNASLCAGPDAYLHKAALDVMASMQMEII